MYVRGTAVVDTLQGSIDSATNAALRELGKKLETRLNSKINETKTSIEKIRLQNQK